MPTVEVEEDEKEKVDGVSGHAHVAHVLQDRVEQVAQVARHEIGQYGHVEQELGQQFPALATAAGKQEESEGIEDEAVHRIGLVGRVSVVAQKGAHHPEPTPILGLEHRRARMALVHVTHCPAKKIRQILFADA